MDGDRQVTLSFIAPSDKTSIGTLFVCNKDGCVDVHLKWLYCCAQHEQLYTNNVWHWYIYMYIIHDTIQLNHWSNVQFLTWWNWYSDIRLDPSPCIIHCCHHYLQCLSQAAHTIKVLSGVCCVRPQHCSITVSSDVDGVVVNGDSL